MKSSGSVVLVIALAAAGCDSEPDMVAAALSDTGTLVHSWTISGSSDASVCAAHGAAQMRLILYDGTGALSRITLESCALFESRRPITASEYMGFVTFLDESGSAVSGTLGLGQVTVVAGRETWTTIDFTATAMHPRRE